MDLERVFDITSEKMKLDWKLVQSSLEHSGQKGTSLEKTVREYLRPYFPKNLAMVTGEISDFEGNTTKQLDIIVYDDVKTPLLFDKGGIRVIPIECVYAVIELKADIGSQDDVDDIFANMQSVKSLEKSSFYETIGEVKHQVDLYGKIWNIWPVHYFVFAVNSMNLDILAQKIHDKHLSTNCDISKRIDCVCVLEKGIIMNRLSNGKYSALPEPGSEITFHESENPFHFFYFLISRFMNQTWIPNFNYMKFARKISFKAKS